MREIINMIVVLTVLSALSGGLLASVRNGTMEKIENQQLEFVKGPAIREILKGCTNDPVADRFKIKDGDIERSFFVGVFDGKPDVVVFEVTGTGFADNFGLMLGVNINDDQLAGVGVTTHKETPGLGANAKDDPGFPAQFKGASIDNAVKITSDGGSINAISGATITSRAVCAAATKAFETYKRLKPQIKKNIQGFAR